MTLYKCERCNEPMIEYTVSFQGGVTPIGYVCMKEGCERHGLVTVTATQREITE